MKNDFEMDRQNLITSVDDASLFQPLKSSEDGDGEDPILL